MCEYRPATLPSRETFFALSFRVHPCIPLGANCKQPKKERKKEKRTPPPPPQLRSTHRKQRYTRMWRHQQSPRIPSVPCSPSHFSLNLLWLYVSSHEPERRAATSHLVLSPAAPRGGGSGSSGSGSSHAGPSKGLWEGHSP